jgi:hypothetical protein
MSARGRRPKHTKMATADITYFHLDAKNISKRVLSGRWARSELERDRRLDGYVGRRSTGNWRQVACTRTRVCMAELKGAVRPPVRVRQANKAQISAKVLPTQRCVVLVEDGEMSFVVDPQTRSCTHVLRPRQRPGTHVISLPDTAW